MKIMSIHNEKLRKKLILIDPDPESFEPYPKKKGYLKPDFPYVSNLIEKRPDVVGNCVLLLIWPEPEALYDFEAVMYLKPLSILILYEKPEGWNMGCAAGKLMHKLLISPESLDYRTISTTRYIFGNQTTPLGRIEPAITWLAKRGSSVPKKKRSLTLQAEADKLPRNIGVFYIPSK